MRILFDQGTPVPIRRHLANHTVGISADLGWERLRNGELLMAAEAAGYELLLTPDKNLRYQQNLTERKIAILVIGHSQWPRWNRTCNLSWKPSVPPLRVAMRR